MSDSIQPIPPQPPPMRIDPAGRDKRGEADDEAFKRRLADMTDDSQGRGRQETPQPAVAREAETEHDEYDGVEEVPEMSPILGRNLDVST